MPLTNVSPFSFIRDQFLLDGVKIQQQFTSNATTDVLACVVALAPGERIDQVGFLCDGATGTFSAVIAIESMSTSVQGNPSGTVQTGINSQPAQSATFHAGDLVVGKNWLPINPYRNDSSDTQIIAITFRQTSGSGSYTIRSQIDSDVVASRFPFVMTRTSGSGNLTGTLGGIPLISARDDRNRVVGCVPNFPQLDSVDTASSMTTDRLVGNKWTAEFACRLSQVCFQYLPQNGTTFDLLVYVNDEIRASQTLPPRAISSTDPSAIPDYSFATLPVGPIQLDAGDVVRLVLKGTSSTPLSIPIFEFESDVDRLAFAGGTSIHRCYGSTAPVWVDTPTDSLASIFPIIDQINFAAGLGGSPGGGLQRSVIYKNVEDQWVFFRLVDGAGVPINDAEPESFTISLVTANTDGSPSSPAAATNDAVFIADGVYGLTITQDESNHDMLVLTASHALGKVSPVIIETSPQVPEVTVLPGSLAMEN